MLEILTDRNFTHLLSFQGWLDPVKPPIKSKVLHFTVSLFKFNKLSSNFLIYLCLSCAQRVASMWQQQSQAVVACLPCVWPYSRRAWRHLCNGRKWRVPSLFPFCRNPGHRRRSGPTALPHSWWRRPLNQAVLFQSSWSLWSSRKISKCSVKNNNKLSVTEAPTMSSLF